VATSITSILGAGSGLDTAALIDSLYTATRQPKEAAIVRRETSNQATISALGSVTASIDGFASSLGSLISGGSLFTQPVSSDSSIVSTIAIAGARLTGLTASIEVRQLAQAQTLVSANLTATTDPVGQGSFTLTTALGSFGVTIDATNDNLPGLARAINSANAGVTASVVTDTAGSRLVVKGVTGEAAGFSIAVDGAAQAGLQRFAYPANAGVGMTLAQAAQDAIVVVDGVEVRRALNSFTNLIDGVKVDLKKAVPGTTVSITTSTPTDALRQAVMDFIAVYNELDAALDEATASPTATTPAGGLYGDIGVRQMRRQLAGLTSTQLASGDGPKSLAEIGVRTNRDGTLSVDTARLEAILASDPKGVEALFNPGQSSSSPLLGIVSQPGRVTPGTYTVTDVVFSPLSGTIDGVAATAADGLLTAADSSAARGLILSPSGNVASASITIDLGLGGALKMIRDTLRGIGGPLARSQEKATADAKRIAADRAEMEQRLDAYKEKLTNDFTTMEKRVSAFKATQSYLEQQIKLWTNED
jgi:flagellar hook-associated protein 2